MASNILNLEDGTFSEGSKYREGKYVQKGPVHVRLQQRLGRNTLTTVQGLSHLYDLKGIVEACKRKFGCNGTVVVHPEYGKVIKLQGDQRHNITDLMIKTGIVRRDQIKVHGL